MVDYIPKRGDFIRLNFDPQAGHEQMGSRPALVLSHTPFNRKMGFAFVCPISATKRRNAQKLAMLEKEIGPAFCSVAGNAADNNVLKQLFGLAFERFGRAADIANAIHYIVTQPPHVHISDIVVRPTRQDYP